MPEIGATLQEARMRARVDISEVEAATKIRAKYLRAMENEDWSQLPGPTFVKSFLRTYAEHLGIDGKLLVDEYRQRHEPPPEHDPQPMGPPGLGAESRRRLRPPALSRGWAIGLSVAALLVVLLVLGSLSEDQPTSTPTPTQVTRAVRPRPAPPPKPTRAALTLVPTGEVYVCVRNADGDLLVSQTLAPGSESRTYRSKRLHVTLGNNGAKMQVNGRTLAVPASANAINYELTPEGRRRLPDDENAC